MLSKALPGILPPLSEAESLEVTKIYSITGNIPPGGSLIRNRPFRSPHHTTSQVGLIGGGSNPKPGEISYPIGEYCLSMSFQKYPEWVWKLSDNPWRRLRLYFQGLGLSLFSLSIYAGSSGKSLPVWLPRRWKKNVNVIFTKLWIIKKIVGANYGPNWFTS